MLQPSCFDETTRTDRIEVLREIHEILENKCKPCKVRKRLNKALGTGGKYSQIDNYCNHFCPVGLQLQLLGKQLTRPFK